MVTPPPAFFIVGKGTNYFCERKMGERWERHGSRVGLTDKYFTKEQKGGSKDLYLINII